MLARRHVCQKVDDEFANLCSVPSERGLLCYYNEVFRQRRRQRPRCSSTGRRSGDRGNPPDILAGLTSTVQMDQGRKCIVAVAFGGFHTSAVCSEPTYTVSGEPSADANAGIGRASISQIGTSVHAIGTAPGIIAIINVAKPQND